MPEDRFDENIAQNVTDTETEEPSDTGARKAKKPKEKKGFLRELFEWVEIVCISLIVVMLMFTYVARQARVEGDSMRETFHDGENIIISDAFYTPKQGDVVVFQIPESVVKENNLSTRLSEPLIKRVIATQGQTVYLDYANWKVYVYDDPQLDIKKAIENNEIQPLDEPYINQMKEYYQKLSLFSTMNSSYFGNPYTVEEGKVFVMGDNRNNSTDSRYFGAVDERFILGKVFLRISPFTTENGFK